MAEQTLTMAELKRWLFPFFQRKFPGTFKDILDDDVVRAVNRVQKDLNLEAGLWVERYDQPLDMAAYYVEVQRDILQVYFLKLEVTNWREQRYSWVNDVFVFKNEVAADTPWDIIYLGAANDVTISDNDEIDLPGYALEAFRDLLKVLFEVEFSDVPLANYQELLKLTGFNLRKFKPNDLLRAIPKSKSWLRFGPTDSAVYDITDQKVTAEYVGVDLEGIPYITQ